VAGIGEQRQRVRAPAVESLDRDEGEVRGDADRKGAVVVGGSMNMAWPWPWPWSWP
jgi:hypothetical protein